MQCEGQRVLGGGGGGGWEGPSAWESFEQRPELGGGAPGEDLEESLPGSGNIK